MKVNVGKNGKKRNHKSTSKFAHNPDSLKIIISKENSRVSKNTCKQTASSSPIEPAERVVQCRAVYKMDEKTLMLVVGIQYNKAKFNKP